MYKKIFLRCLLPAALLLGTASGCTRNRAAEKITIAVPAITLAAPVFVAQAKGFFEREGLDATLQRQELGIDALGSVLKDQADFASTAEPPIMFAALAGEKIAVIATVADSNKNVRICARRDRGIAKPGDLRGKTIAIRKGTASDYYLDLFMTYYEIPRNSVRLVNMKFKDMRAALARGTVDAAVDWAPYVFEQQRLLGANGVMFWNELLYTTMMNIVAKQDYVNAHPETVKKILRSLVRAQRFIWERPEEAQKIVDARIGAGSGRLADFNFDVRLSQSLVHALEDETRWAIGNGKTEAAQVPNYLHLIYRKGLEAVSPESVAISGGEVDLR